MIATRMLALAATLVVVAGCGGGPDGDPAEGPDRRIALLNFDEQLEADPQLTDMAISLPGPVRNRTWRMEGGNPAHLLAHPALGEQLRRSWRRDIGQGSNADFRIATPPVVDGGLLFAMDGRGRVSAYDVEKGRKEWSRTLRSPLRRDRRARSGGLATADGRVFVTTGFGAVIALSAETGDEVWRQRTAAPMHAPPTVAGGRLFAVSVDNELYALSVETGEILWTYQSLSEPARILSPSSPAVRGDVVVAPFASGELAALRVDNGRTLWSEALTRNARTNSLGALNDIAGSPVIVGDTVYSISHSGVMAALSLRTGERQWVRPAGGIHRPWVSGAYIYIVTTDAQLVCLSRYDGRVFWLRQLKLYRNPDKRRGKVAWSGPLLAGERLYLASADDGKGRLHAHSPLTGEQVEVYRVGDEVLVPPVVADQTLYVVDDKGRLSAFR